MGKNEVISFFFKFYIVVVDFKNSLKGAVFSDDEVENQKEVTNGFCKFWLFFNERLELVFKISFLKMLLLINHRLNFVNNIGYIFS
jgi:hypothetical protein